MVKENQGWSIQHPHVVNKVFEIPVTRDRVVVTACTLSPQKAYEVCFELCHHLRILGMVKITDV